MLLNINFLFDAESKKVKIKFIEPKIKEGSKIDQALENFNKTAKKKSLSKSSYRTFLYGYLSEFITEVITTKSINKETNQEEEIISESTVIVEDTIFLEKIETLNKTLFV